MLGRIQFSKIQVGRLIVDYALIAVGAVLVALAADLFAIPNKVVPGGVTGIATILHYTLGTPVGAITLALNVPLFLAGIRWGGGMRFAARTLFATVIMTLSIDFFAPRVQPITHDPLLYTLYGGILDGIGVGLVFRARGTTGGTDILAQLLNRWIDISLSVWLLVLNVLILGAAGMVFGWEQALYALILSFVSSRTIDVVQEGLSYSKSAFIVSNHAASIRRAIIEQLGRGVTVLQGWGGYTESQRTILLSVVAQSEVSQLKELIHSIDEQAFVIIGQAQEVLGEGFKKLDQGG